MAFLGMDFSTTDFNNWAAYMLVLTLFTIISLIAGGALVMTLLRLCYKLKKEEEAFEQDYGAESNITSFVKFLKCGRDYEIVNIVKTMAGGKKIGICLESGLNDSRDPGIFVRRVKEKSDAEYKLFPGDRILTVNGQQVTSVQHAEKAIRDAGAIVNFHVKRVSFRQKRINKAYAEYLKDRQYVFSRHQLEEIEDGFSLYDKAGKGIIKNDSVVPLVRSLGYNLHEAEVWVYMNELGFTANPKIKLEDFVKIMHLIVTAHVSYEDDIALAYSVFEDDKGVFLTTDKFKMAMERIPGRNKVKQSEINDMLKMVDGDVLDGGNIDMNGLKKLVLPTMKIY